MARSRSVADVIPDAAGDDAAQLLNAHLRQKQQDRNSRRRALFAGLVVLVAAAFMVESSRLWILLTVAVVLGVVRVVAEQHRPNMDPDNGPIGLAIDAGMAVLLACLGPSTWVLAVVAATVQIIWQGLTAPGSRIAMFGVPLFALLGVTGAIGQPQGWLGIYAVAMAFSLLFSSLGHNVRSVTLRTQDDLAELLATAGALVHFSDGTSTTTTQISGPIEDVTGWTKGEWTSLDHRALIHPDDLDDFWIDDEAMILGASFDRKARFRRRDGSYAWLRDVSRTVIGDEGRVGIRGFTIDSTELEEAQEVIRRQASTDQLTGLSNRYVLSEQIDGLLETERPFALFLLDLDRFKAINDTLGHEVGDQVLEQIASRLQAVARDGDTVVRLGGDEFAMVVVDIDDDATASDLARSVSRTCDEPIVLTDIDLTVEISLGAALAPRDGSDAHTLLRRADLAMYDAKSKGTSYRIYDGGVHTAPVEHLVLSSQIAGALASGELLLHFQPKVDIASGAVTGFEGLARWDHPTLGLLSPDRFIDLVTVSNHSQAFAFHVLERGIAFAARCKAAGRPVPIAVNLAARSLYDPYLAGRLAELLEEHDVDSSLLVVEITEQDIMDSSGQASSVVAQIAALGAGVSIDDFGTGYSSLSRLADLPVSEIKVDQRFVAALDVDASCVIVQSIIDLGRNLGLAVVAEGVEDQRQAVALSSYGVTSAQGYLFARPADPDAALALLAGGPLLHRRTELV